MNYKNYKRINIFYACIIIIYTIAEGLYGYGFTAFMYSRGVSLTYIGMLLGITDIFITIFDYPSGNIADKYGRKKICGIGFLIYGIGFCVFASAGDVFIFFISCIIRALGAALISGAPTAWYLGELSKRGESKNKDKVLPMVRGASLFFGSVSGIMAATLADINMALPIFVGGTLLIVFSFFILFMLDDNKAGNIENKNLIFLTIENTRTFIKDRNMRIITTITLFKSVPFAIFIVSWQIFATIKIGLDEKYLGLLYTAMLLLMSLTSFTVRQLLKKLKGVLISILGAGVSCVGLILFVMATKELVFLVGFIIYEVGLGVLNASYYTWLYDFIPENVLSSYSSALSSIESFMSFVMSFCIGGFIQIAGYSLGWMVAALFEFGIIVFLLKLIPEEAKND